MKIETIITLVVYVAVPIAAVLAVWAILPPRAHCWFLSHDWNALRPRMVQKQRVEDCRRCFATREHVPPRGVITPRLSQLDLDGTIGRPGHAKVISPAELDDLRTRCEELANEAEKAFREAAQSGGVESLEVN